MIFNRPWPLLILVVILIFFSGYQWVHVGEALANWDFLSSLPTPVPPLYLALTGLGWGVFGVVVLWRLWVGRPKARRLAGILTVTFVLYYWFEQLVLMDNPLRKTSWEFSAWATSILIAIIFLLLQFKSVKEFSGDLHEQEEQD